MTNLIKTRTEKEMEKWLSMFEELKSYLLANNNKYPILKKIMVNIPQLFQIIKKKNILHNG